jgi:hypothetical protein
MPQSDLIQALHNPGLYSLPNDQRVDFIQTHISCLFLTADHVYKLKKAVNLGFLDFSTLEKRHFYCQEEVRLNSRLAPSVYLGVLAVSKNQAGQFFLGQDQKSEVVDYIVQMRRLSEDSMLLALFRQGKVDESLLNELAGLLAAFHLQAQPVPKDTEMGSLFRIQGNIQENFEQTEMLRDLAISSKRHILMRRLMLWFLQTNQSIFNSRHERGKTRECHGDLRMEHICRFEGRLIIFDCIEFNERFRFIDTTADLSFLLMDMEFHGYTSYADTLLHAYIQASKDQEAQKVIDLYKAYYALTRGKVFGIESTEEDFTQEEQRHALEQSVRFLHLAWSYVLRLHPPTLIMLCGIMGTGKSEVARHLGQELCAHVLRSDEVRKKLYGLNTQSRDYSAYGYGLYTREATENTYQALMDSAQKLLTEGGSVILDASFIRQHYREMGSDVANSRGVKCILLECVCPDEILEKRLQLRQDQGTDVSDGRSSLLANQKADFEPITASKNCEHVVIDTSKDLHTVLESTLLSVIETLCPDVSHDSER